ncbi:MAG: hypothetical protein P1P90_04955 [Patescibacteria group bacterium]|nr:hypothetical protein [Patescibacteria group bacterium]
MTSPLTHVIKEPLPAPKGEMMPQLMYFYIVRSHKEGEARVIREFHEDIRGRRIRPSGTLFEIKREIDLADLTTWEEINKQLADGARELGITTLHNLYPPEDMMAAVKVGEKIRKRLHSAD